MREMRELLDIEEDDGKKYQIVRMYFRGGKRVMRRGLTLQEAQAHCRNPETSSRTAQSAAAKKITARMGPWFDGYEEMKKGRKR